MSAKYFIDTNILVYAHDKSDRKKRETSQQIIFDGMKKENVIVSTQVFSEFFVTVTQKIREPLSVDLAKKELLLLSHFQMVEIDLSMILEAIDLKTEHRISYWDGLIICAAKYGECSHILSEDMQHGQSFGNLTVINPYIN